jgi:NitT/TauT family transport system substrate-binding protein
MNRRAFLKLSSYLSIAAPAVLSSQLLSACKKAQPIDKNQPALRIGYVPAVCAIPMLIGYSQGFFADEGLLVEKPLPMQDFDQMSKSLLAGEINFAHILFPMLVNMHYAHKHPIKGVACNHVNGSALTVSNKQGFDKLDDIGGKRIAVSHPYSMGNIILQICLRKLNIDILLEEKRQPNNKQTNIIVMKAADMPEALVSGAIDGYVVEEPYNAMSEASKHGKIIRFTGDIYQNHPCCLAVMREKDLQQYPDWTQKVVNGLVKAQQWAAQNADEVAHIISTNGDKYLPMPEPVLQRALSEYDIEIYGTKHGNGAIHHPDWKVSRIGYEPYPYPPTTWKIIRLLQQTKFASKEQSAFLQSIDVNKAPDELFSVTSVVKAAEKVGGLQQFDGVDPDNPYVRHEVIEV